MFKTKSNHHQFGFTLIELLVVIVVIGTLATVTVIIINPQGKMAQARDNQREVHGGAIWHAIEQMIFSEGSMVDCESIPTSETKISSADYNLYECIYPEYLQEPFYDPTTGHFNSTSDYDTGYYIATDSFGNQYFRAEGETRTVVIGQEPEFTVITNSATGIGETSGTLNGELTNMGDATTVDVWFEYGITDSLELGSVCTDSMSDLGSFNCSLADLDLITRYYFSAFGENTEDAEESSQGRTRSFLTGE